MVANLIWTPEQDNYLLKRKLLEHATVDEIAAEITDKFHNHTITRNSVAGRLFRLRRQELAKVQGIPVSELPNPGRPKRNPWTDRPPTKLLPTGEKPVPKPKRLRARPADPDARPSGSGRAEGLNLKRLENLYKDRESYDRRNQAVADLEPNQCRWIEDDGRICTNTRITAFGKLTFWCDQHYHRVYRSRLLPDEQDA